MSKRYISLVVETMNARPIQSVDRRLIEVLNLYLPEDGQLDENTPLTPMELWTMINLLSDSSKNALLQLEVDDVENMKMKLKHEMDNKKLTFGFVLAIVALVTFAVVYESGHGEEVGSALKEILSVFTFLLSL